MFEVNVNIKPATIKKIDFNLPEWAKHADPNFTYTDPRQFTWNEHGLWGGEFRLKEEDELVCKVANPLRDFPILITAKGNNFSEWVIDAVSKVVALLDNGLGKVEEEEIIDYHNIEDVNLFEGQFVFFEYDNNPHVVSDKDGKRTIFYNIRTLIPVVPGPGTKVAKAIVTIKK